MKNMKGKRGAGNKVLIYTLCPTLLSYTYGTDCYQRQAFGLGRRLHGRAWLFLHFSKTSYFR